MNIFHPGGWDLTKQAVELCGFKAGDRILDIGCGEGVTMSKLRDELNMKPVGCDRDENILKRAKERDPGLKLRTTDGVMLDFPSKYFDGAIMECSFSLVTRHDELLHELWCVLKDGGSLAITDLYVINPDRERAAEAYYEAKLKLNTPRVEGDCEDDEEEDIKYPSPYLLDGMFVIDNLMKAVMDTGFEITAFRDKTRELNNYIAQILIDYGSVENMWKETLPEGSKPYCKAKIGKNTGYFILTARKPVK